MAEKSDKQRLDRIGQLVVELRECQAKAYAITEELAQLAGGTATDTAVTKEVAEYFDRIWCQRYLPGRDHGYVWRRTADFPSLRSLIKQLGRDEVEGRMLTYIKSDDPFYARPGNRHSFGLFVAAINGLASAASAPAAEWQCPDDPPCNAGTSAWACHQRAELNEARRASGRPTQ